MITDMHAHVDDVPTLGWHMTAASVIEQMERARIDRTVIMTIVDAPAVNPHALEDIANAVSLYESRLIGFVRVHPWYGDAAISLVHRAVTEFGFRGVKLHPISNLSRPGGEATTRIIRAATEVGVPVVFHSGDENLVTPWELCEAARACPDARIIFAHIGGYAHTEDALDAAADTANVYLETSAMPYPASITAAVSRIGADRVIFGSDSPGCSARIELAKIDRAQLTSADRHKLLTSNAEQLLAAPR